MDEKMISVSFRLPESEYKLLKEKSKKMGVLRGKYIRFCINPEIFQSEIEHRKKLQAAG